ncbi:MAG: C-terminal target protein [Ignavibacteria bacterium]|nr:C-terminal target protein [Ignavibacteria bacterium]
MKLKENRNPLTPFEKGGIKVPPFSKGVRGFLFFILFIFQLTFSAYSQSFKIFSISGTYPFMTAAIQVIDTSGKEIRDMTPAELKLTENGRERKITKIDCPMDSSPCIVSWKTDCDFGDVFMMHRPTEANTRVSYSLPKGVAGNIITSDTIFSFPKMRRDSTENFRINVTVHDKALSIDTILFSAPFLRLKFNQKLPIVIYKDLINPVEFVFTQNDTVNQKASITLRGTFCSGDSVINVSSTYKPGPTDVSENLLLDVLPFSIYPNPANNLLTIKFQTEVSNCILSVYNSFGELIKNIPVNNYSEFNTIEIDLSDYSQGCYFLRYSADGQSRIVPFAVMK